MPWSAPGHRSGSAGMVGVTAADKAPTEKVPGDSPDAGLQAALDRCREPLRDFASCPENRTGFARAGRPATRVAVPAEQLPVPGSVMLVMRLLLDAQLRQSECGEARLS